MKRVRGSSLKMEEIVFGKSIMNTCCNEWRNLRFWMGVHERKKKKNGTYFFEKAILAVLVKFRGSQLRRTQRVQKQVVR